MSPGVATIATVILGPEVLNRVDCEGETILLRGWHRARVGMGEGLTIDGQVHSTTPTDAPRLRECFQDGVTEIGSMPLVQQLGISGLLGAIQLELDENDEKDVNLTVNLSPRQTGMVMTLLGMIDGSSFP